MLSYVLVAFISVFLAVFFFPREWSVNFGNESTKGAPARLLSRRELSLYNGEEGSKGLYLAILGQVFDVHKGHKHYGPGGAYHSMTGDSPFLLTVFNTQALRIKPQIDLSVLYLVDPLNQPKEGNISSSLIIVHKQLLSALANYSKCVTVLLGKDASLAFVTGDFTETGLTDDLSSLSPLQMVALYDWLSFYHRHYQPIGMCLNHFIQTRTTQQLPLGQVQFSMNH